MSHPIHPQSDVPKATGFHIAQDKTPYLFHPATSALARHGFFSAEGGLSTGVYASLNCGFGSADSTDKIAANRGIAAAALQLDQDQMAAVYQIHSADCITVDGPTANQTLADRDQMIRADGLVTTSGNLGLTILTADCLPLLLADEEGKVIGACHAGWRGAAGGIVANTTDAMRRAGATNITALIGPTIRQPSYQVGSAMRDEVLAMVATSFRDLAAACFAPDDGTYAPSLGAPIISNEDGPRFRFDLAGLVQYQLAACGVMTVHDCGVDTYYDQGISGEANGRLSDPDSKDKDDFADSLPFFSHRRATHTKMADCGRQISIIARTL